MTIFEVEDESDLITDIGVTVSRDWVVLSFFHQGELLERTKYLRILINYYHIKKELELLTLGVDSPREIIEHIKSKCDVL
jgi:hypothetical protein